MVTVVPVSLGVAGDIASVAGLVISVIVWLQVRSIKRSFVLRARLPELLVALRAISADLLKVLKNSDMQPGDPRAELARLNALLTHLMDKVERPQREMAKRILDVSREGGSRRLVTVSWKEQQQRDEVWQVYFGVEESIESLTQVNKDSKWS